MPKRTGVKLLFHVGRHPQDASALRLLGRKYGAEIPEARRSLGQRGIYFRRPR